MRRINLFVGKIEQGAKGEKKADVSVKKNGLLLIYASFV